MVRRDALLEEEMQTLEQIEQEINSDDIEVVEEVVERASSTSSSSDTESSSDSDSN